MKKFKLKFKIIYNDKMNCINVSNISKIYDKSFNEICESKGILNRPDLLLKIKEIVLGLNENKLKNKVVKVNILNSLNDSYCQKFEDDNLYKDLINLFKTIPDAYVNVKLANDESLDPYGRFWPPEKFIEIDFNISNEYNLPEIKPISVSSSLTKLFCQRMNHYSKFKKEFYDKRNISLKSFRESILTDEDKCLGEIEINVNRCIEDNENLDDVICHECQHFFIFLLSLAKTYVYFGLHFSNNLSTLKYELNEAEFLPLAESYIKILKRTYESIDDKNKSINKFVHLFLNEALLNKKSEYSQYFNSYRYVKIFSFFKLIYEDENYSKQDTIFNKHTLRNEKTPTTYFKNNMHKFKTLIKWTVKGLENEEIQISL